MAFTLIHVVLLIGAFICFLLATVGVGSGKVNLVALGLMLCVLVYALGGVPAAGH